MSRSEFANYPAVVGASTARTKVEKRKSLTLAHFGTLCFCYVPSRFCFLMCGISGTSGTTPFSDIPSSELFVVHNLAFGASLLLSIVQCSMSGCFGVKVIGISNSP